MTGTEAERQDKEGPARLTRGLSFYQGVVFTGTGISVNIVTLLVETMVAARLLDPGGYGIYVLLVVTVNFLVTAVDFGFKTAVTKLIAGSDHIRQTALANSALVFRLLVIAVVFAFIWLGRGLLLPLAPSQGLFQYAAYVPVMLAVASLDELLLAMLQGFQAYHHIAVAQTVRSVLRLCLSILFLTIVDMGVMALIYSWVISFAVSASYLYLVLPISKRFTCQRPELCETLRFGFPLQGNRLLWFVSAQIDVLLLGMLVGPTAVAFFNVAARIPLALMRLAESYTAVFFPTMAALLAETKHRQAGRLLDHSLRLLSFSVGLIALIAVLFSQQIITVIFSEKYTASSAAFAVLMIAFHMAVLLNLMGYTLTSAGFPGRSLAVNVIRTALVVLADLVLIPVFGFIGPAYTRFISYYATNPIAVRMLRRSDVFLKMTPYVKQTALLLLCVAFFWWAQPTTLALKVVIIVLFVVLNVTLSTISRDDLILVLPAAVIERLDMRKGVLSNGR